MRRSRSSPIKQEQEQESESSSSITSRGSTPRQVTLDEALEWHLKTKRNTTNLSAWVTPLGETEALSYFFNTIAYFALVGNPADHCHGWLSEVEDLYAEAQPVSQLPVAAAALSMVNLGVAVCKPSLVMQARGAYAKCLRMINESLQDPRASRMDDTLVAVQLLGYFEFVMSTYEGRPYSDHHGKALSLLVKHRGYDQLKERRSRRLFFDIQNQVLNACIYRLDSAEPLLGDLLWVVDDPEYPGTRLTAIMSEVVSIQIRAKEILSHPNGLDTLGLVENLLIKAKDVDADLCKWSLSLRPSWQFTWLEADEACTPGYAFGTHVHTYKTLWIARIWNAFRTARIKLQATVSDLLGLSNLLGGISAIDEQVKTQNILQRMVDEVCASVPFCLGNQTPLDQQPVARFPMDVISKRNSLHAWTMGWFLLLVPLQSCSKTPHISDSQRAWIRHQLSRVCQIGTMFMGGRDIASLLSGTLPTFAFSMAIGSLSDADVECELSDSAWQTALINSGMPDGDFDEASEMLNKARGEAQKNLKEVGPSPSLSSTAKVRTKASEEGWLDFINTTKPDEIKDRALQKKIRRDVMLNHLRNNQGKEKTPPGSRKASRRPPKVRATEG
ncbi:MAG: hypothetical protein M1828_007428 [Chrysothrix sp. TS-e1954]|nr:MAG: hypothetical protein M1828_007428 [Chrysothrix sp. TS-e1954]